MVTLLTFLNSVGNRDRRLIVYKAADLLDISDRQPKPSRRRRLIEIRMRSVGHRVERVCLSASQADPTRATSIMLAVKTVAFPVSSINYHCTLPRVFGRLYSCLH